MKQLLLTIATLVLVGCGPSVDIHKAVEGGNIEAVKQAIADGADVNAKNDGGETPLDRAIKSDEEDFINLLRKHGAKTAEELKAEGK